MSPLESARATLATAEAALQALRDDATARQAAWDQLGREPAVRAEPREPVAPVRTRPTQEQLDAAVTLDASYPAAKALHERYAADRQRLDARVAETTEAADRATATAGRISATHNAAKSAPSAIAAELVGQLPLPPGIGVTFTPKGMELTLDGRAWDAPGSRRYRGISSGREVEADLLWRAMMRRLAGERIGKVWTALPLGVDDEVLLNAGGSLPDVGGPVIVLRTTAGGDLGVAGG